jgi:hypothetical protein
MKQFEWEDDAEYCMRVEIYTLFPELYKQHYGHYAEDDYESTSDVADSEGSADEPKSYLRDFH